MIELTILLHDNASKFKGRLTEFKNVNKQGFWEGAIDSVIVNGRNLNLIGRTGILDTVSKFSLCSAKTSAEIYELIWI